MTENTQLSPQEIEDLRSRLGDYQQAQKAFQSMLPQRKTMDLDLQSVIIGEAQGSATSLMEAFSIEELVSALLSTVEERDRLKLELELYKKVAEQFETHGSIHIGMENICFYSGSASPEEAPELARYLKAQESSKQTKEGV